MMTTKICSKCHRSLLADLEHFFKQSAAKSGLCPWCKKCMIMYGQSKGIKKKISQAHKKYYATIRGYLKQTYDNIRKRCDNCADKSYKNYGGRGIRCLFQSFDEFYEYVINVLRVDPRKLTVDRIDNDGNYEPGNIQFVTHRENQQNKRKSR